MAGEYKVSYLISEQSSRSAGWSMNFWNKTTTTTTLQTRINTMLGLIQGILGGQAVVDGYRVSSVDTARKGWNATFEGSSAAAVTDANDTDYPTTAAYLKLWSSDTTKTAQWVRGLPDKIIKNVGKLAQSLASWKTASDAFLAKLVTSSGGEGWCIRRMDQAQPEQAISSVDLATGIITFKAAHPFTVLTNVKVRIKGFTYPQYFNGIHKVWVPTNTTIQLTPYTNQAPSAATAVLLSTASVKPLIYLYEDITLATWEYSTSHKTGRPSRQLSGRRKSANKW